MVSMAGRERGRNGPDWKGSMSARSLRVLVVDDTVTYRKIVSDVLERLPDVEVVGVAANGRIALQKIEQTQPDLLTLDLEMPEIDGLGLLKLLKERNLSVGAIMLSAFTTQGADATVAALKLGAFDFVVKPAGTDMAENAASLERDLRQKIQAFAKTRAVTKDAEVRARTPAGPTTLQAGAPARAAESLSSEITRRMSRIAIPHGKPEVIAVGISTGGPEALSRMLPLLPADLAAPVVIVQHMPPKFTLSLAQDLAARCRLQCSEARDGDPVCAGRILIAPGGRQMKLVRQADAGMLVVRVTDDPPENHCRPSVDYLFRSVAHVCGGRSVGVIMTGMGSDGALGCRLMKRQGAPVLAQDEASCVVYGMPKAIVEEGLADSVVPLDQMASEITRVAGRGALACS